MTRRKMSRTRQILISTAVLIVAGTVSSESQVFPSTGPDQQITVGATFGFPGFCVAHFPTDEFRGIFGAIYETLVVPTSDGRFVPFLAESLSPDSTFKEWTIRIRSGITFHDGTPLDAAAVAMNINVWRGQDSPTSDFVTGGKGYTSTRIARLAEISTVETTSSHQMIVRLSRPTNNLPEILFLSGAGYVLAPSQLLTFSGSKRCAVHPVGTGPFQFVSYDTQRLDVAKNANYWRSDPTSGGKLPRLSNITFLRRSESEKIAGLRDASLDLAFFSSVKEISSIRDLRSDNRLVEFQTRPEDIYGIWLNESLVGSPFANIHARRAIAHATDIEELNKSLWKSENRVPKSIVDPSSPMYSMRNLRSFDLEEAKRAVSQYRADTGIDLSVTLVSSIASWELALVETLKTMWERAGISVRINQMELASKAATVFGSTNRAQAVVYNHMSGAVPTSYSRFLRGDSGWADSNSDTKTSLKSAFRYTINAANHRNTGIDNSLADGQAAITSADRASSYQTAVADFQAQAYMVPLTNGYQSWFTQQTIDGLYDAQYLRGVFGSRLSYYGPEWAFIKEVATRPSEDRGKSADPMRVIERVVARPNILEPLSDTEMLIGSTVEGTLKRVKIADGSITASINAVDSPLDTAISSNSSVVYVVQAGSGLVFKFQLTDYSVSSVASFGEGDFSIDLSRDGNNLYGVDSRTGTVKKMLIQTGATTTVTSVSDGGGGVVVTPDSSTLFVAQPAVGRVAKVSLTNKSVSSSDVTFFDVGKNVSTLSLDPTGEFLFATDGPNDLVNIIRTTDASSIARLAVVDSPTQASLSTDGRTVIVSSGFSGKVEAYGVSLPTAKPPTATTTTIQVPESPASSTTTTPLSTSTNTASVNRRASITPAMGRQVRILKYPSSLISTSTAVAIKQRRITVILTTPRTSVARNQVIRYRVKLKPTKGTTISRLITAKSGMRLTPALTGRAKTRYQVVVEAQLRSGRSVSWSGPVVTTGK